MKLSLSTDAFLAYLKRGESLVNVLKTISDSGFHCIDYDMTDKDNAEPAVRGRELKEILARLGMTAPQAHSSTANPLLPENRQEWVKAQDAVRFCKAAGIPAIVVHPGALEGNSREQFFEKNAEFYRSLIPVCEETGVGVLLENIGNYADPYYLWTGKDLRELVELVNHPLFTACWDTGHANHFWPEDCKQYESILALKGKLTALHVQDNAGYFSDTRRHSRIDMHMPPYFTWCGNVNFDAVLKGLADIGYKGTFNFELSCCQIRRNVDPFMLDGETINRLELPPLRIAGEIYHAVYEVGKYMLETYQAFDED